MNSNGIFRKIDELGRIVIPKEVRDYLNIRAGDDFEIFVKDKCVFLKKYSRALTNCDIYNSILYRIKPFLSGDIYICDKEKVITSGDLVNKFISDNLKNIMDNRELYASSSIETHVFSNVKKSGFYLLSPIIKNSDIMCMIIFIKNKQINHDDILTISLVSSLI